MNQLVLHAKIYSVSPLRYTPAGVPVLEMVLCHHSEQSEVGNTRQVSLTIDAKIIGKDALGWQHAEGKEVEVSGFLTQRSQKSTRLVLHIQSINFSKG